MGELNAHPGDGTRGRGGAPDQQISSTKQRTPSSRLILIVGHVTCPYDEQLGSSLSPELMEDMSSPDPWSMLCDEP